MYVGRPNFNRRPHALRGRLSDFRILGLLPAVIHQSRIVRIAGWAFLPSHCVGSPVKDARPRLWSMAATNCGGENGLRREIVAPRSNAMLRKSRSGSSEFRSRKPD